MTGIELVGYVAIAGVCVAATGLYAYMALRHARHAGSSTLATVLLLRRPPETPLAFWRDIEPLRWLSIAGVVGLVGTLVWMGQIVFNAWANWHDPWRRSGSRIPGWAMIVGAAWCIFVFGRAIGYSWAKRRWYARVTRHDFRVCLDCGYRMEGLPDNHACPECGRVFFSAPTEGAWKRWMESNDERNPLAWW